MTTRDDHHRLTPLSLPEGILFVKPGVRGYPEVPGPVSVLRRMGRPPSGPFIDASATAGSGALVALAAGVESVSVLEPSSAALRCARASLERASVDGAGSRDAADGETVTEGRRARAGLPWDLEPGDAAAVALAPPSHRGNVRVVAELRAAARALRPDGTLYLALHKDEGGKRYEKIAASLFETAEVVARDRGWRLTVAHGPVGPEAPQEDPPLWTRFEAAGIELAVLPGVHSAGRLDPGTRVLVDSVPWPELSGRRVLDLGCGSGVLALLAARAGAMVTAVDDDLAAVVSTARSASEAGLAVDARHSDVDGALVGERFDVVLTNPPFHVGRGVRLEIPEAFIAASRALLERGGELWLVANRQLPYERVLGDWRKVERVADEAGFKVLVARR